MPRLLDVIETARVMTDRVLVAYSGGKDSVVTLDLCCKHFPHVAAFHMHYAPDLSFQERNLRWAEKHYGIEIMRIPHFEVSDLLRDGVYHAEDASVRRVSIAEVYAYAREQTDTFWIAAGERIADSIVRRAMIVKDGTVNANRGRIFPVAHWTKAHITAYIRRNNLRVSEEAAILGHSFRGLEHKDLAIIKQSYPEDYRRIVAMYPLVEAGVKWQEFYGTQKDANARGDKRIPEV